LILKSDVDGAHVFIDGHQVGVVGTGVPYANPFLPSGPHFVEVRKAGQTRWGSLVELKSGESKTVKARLPRARRDVYQREYAPLANLVLSGREAHSEDYIAELLFAMAELYGVQEMVLVHLTKINEQKGKMTMVSFVDGGLDTYAVDISLRGQGYETALRDFWKARFKIDLSPQEAVTSTDAFAPTLFKVDE